MGTFKNLITPSSTGCRVGRYGPWGLVSLVLSALLVLPAASSTASFTELRVKGDVEADFGAGALLLTGLAGGDAAVTLSAKKIDLRYVQEDWFYPLEVGRDQSIQTTEGAFSDFEKDADDTETFYGARLSLEGFDAADLLVFNSWENPWTSPTFRVSGQDSDGVLAPVAPTRLIDVPRQQGSDDAAFPEDRQFVYDVDVTAFEWRSTASATRPTAMANGEFSFYLYGGDVKLTPEDGTEQAWTTGYRVAEEHGRTPVGRAAYTDRYSYIVATAYDASLEITVEPEKLAWYSPEPQMRVLGTVATPPTEGEETAEPPPADGELLVEAHYTDEGAQFDLVDPDLQTAAAAPSPDPGLAPDWTWVGAMAGVVVVLAAAFLVIRWYSWSRFVPSPPTRTPHAPRPRDQAPLPVPSQAVRARASPHVAVVRSALPGETTKEAVLHLIEKKPGVHLSGLASDLGIHRSLAFHHVRDLVRKGLVYAVPLGGKHALFRVGAIDPAAARGLAALAAPRTAAVADLLYEKPAITIQRVADGLAMSPRSAARELQRLRSAGLALRDMLANPARFHPSDLLKRLHEGVPATPAPPVVLGTNGHSPSVYPAVSPMPAPL